MKVLNIFLKITVVLCLTACTPQNTTKDTVIPSPFTERIVNMFVSTGMCEDRRTIVVRAAREEAQLVSLLVDAPPVECPPYGRFYGVYSYGKYRVELWGDSIDDFFWKTTEPSVWVEMDTTLEPIFYDPCDWFICIDLSDTTLLPLLCYFPCGFPLPTDTLTKVFSQTKTATFSEKGYTISN